MRIKTALKKIFTFFLCACLFLSILNSTLVATAENEPEEPAAVSGNSNGTRTGDDEDLNDKDSSEEDLDEEDLDDGASQATPEDEPEEPATVSGNSSGTKAGGDDEEPDDGLIQAMAEDDPVGLADKIAVTNITDWSLAEDANADTKWNGPGNEGKEITVARDGDALAAFDADAPTGLLTYLEEQYKSLSVYLWDGEIDGEIKGRNWYNLSDSGLIWSYDESLSSKLSNNYRAFYVFKVESEVYEFYGHPDNFEKTEPLQLYLYIVTTSEGGESVVNDALQWRLLQTDASESEPCLLGLDSGTDYSDYGREYIDIPQTIDNPEASSSIENFAKKLKQYYPTVEVRTKSLVDRGIANQNTYEVYPVSRWEYRREKSEGNYYVFEAVTDKVFFSVNERGDMQITDDGDYDLNLYVRVNKTPLTRDALKDHIVKEKQEPENITINLFDYWINDDNHYDEWGNPWDDSDQFSNASQYNQGINRGHALKFMRNGAIANFYSKEGVDLIGGWNYNSINQEQNVTGIVAKTLTDGYPVLALNQGSFASQPGSLLPEYGNINRTESLAYLFAPSNGTGKTAYSNVTGLLQMNSDGYYYYDSKLNFAEYDKGTNQFILYDTWAVSPNGGSPDGQFFPFNNGLEVFQTNEGGKLQSYPVNNYNKTISYGSLNNRALNHYLGLTMEMEFLQPINGMVGTKPMTFEFAGDDDIWIFVDDVLVLDLGGLHSGVYGSIDFNTGIVKTALMDINADGAAGAGNNWSTNYLDELFKDANKDTSTWTTNASSGHKTFASQTNHTIKLFYMERGHWDSNFAMYFNLQDVVPDRIRKVDENGQPLGNVQFALYEAKENSTFDNSKDWHTADEFQTTGNAIATVKTGSDGYAELLDSSKKAIAFSERQATYYILREQTSPAGYRTNPDIVMEYHPETNTFLVVNKYEVGAYASAVSQWLSVGDVNYGIYSNAGKVVSGSPIYHSSNEVGANDLDNGLAIVVPVIKLKDANGAFQRWLPMYGSNTYGWNTVTDGYSEGNAQENLEKNLAIAAFLQIATENAQDWYLTWNNASKRLEGQLENLPGDATRYVITNENWENADLDLMTLFLTEGELQALGLNSSNSYADDEARYAALKQQLKNVTDQAAAKKLIDRLGNNPFALLYTDDFSRTRGTVVYVPNEQRELRVCKVDENGTPINGAVFALYTSPADAAAGRNAVATGTTSTVTLENSNTTRDGMLIFRQVVPAGRAGYAKVSWPSQRLDGQNTTYWLKEIKAPEGYDVNENLVRVEVGSATIYANATGYDAKGSILTGAAKTNDGITVQAALGKLAQTLVKYAAGNQVDVTLQDITIYEQIQSDGVSLTGWQETDQSFELHYNMNAAGLTGQYGLHDSTDAPVFVADDGYIRVMPRQTTDLTDLGDGHDSTAHRAKLTNGGTAIDLDGLFGLMNVVVIQDRPASKTSNKPSYSNTSTRDKSQLTETSELAVGNPKTGDTLDLTLWIVVLVGGIVDVGVVGSLSLKRKRRWQDRLME